MEADLIPRMILSLVAMLLSLTVHEYAHARVAHWLGDDTASMQGRMSLNPLVHIDPVGTLLLPVVGSLSGIALFGWARPVPTNPVRYTRQFNGKRIHMTTGLAMVAAAGPLSNILFALLLAGGLRVATLVSPGLSHDQAAMGLLLQLLMVNLGLFVFNLIPLPPLDGSRILFWLLPDRHKPIMDLLARNTPLVFVGLFLLMQTRLFSAIFVGPVLFLFGLIMRLLGLY